MQAFQAECCHGFFLIFKLIHRIISFLFCTIERSLLKLPFYLPCHLYEIMDLCFGRRNVIADRNLSVSNPASIKKDTPSCALCIVQHSRILIHFIILKDIKFIITSIFQSAVF